MAPKETTRGNITGVSGVDLNSPKGMREGGARGVEGKPRWRKAGRRRQGIIARASATLTRGGEYSWRSGRDGLASSRASQVDELVAEAGAEC